MLTLVSLNVATGLHVVGGEFGGNTLCCPMKGLLGMVSHAGPLMKTFIFV